MKYILTILPTLKKSAFKELKEIDLSLKIKNLDSYIFLIETIKEYFQNELKKTIFIRHSHPVNKEILLERKKEVDFNEILSNVLKIIDIKGNKFMVQCRKVGKEIEYKSKDIEVFIGSNLERLGGIAVYDDKKVLSELFIDIISVLIVHNTCYIGISKVKDNLEPYSDPARIYSRWHNSISRAEFKLREAIRKFEIKLEKGMNALDLGAAPGGWSKVLQEFGLNVTAVDPAELDPRLNGVNHFKGKSEEFSSNEKYDILVNDMNMNPIESARITKSMIKFLKDNAKVVFTAKLVKKDYDNLIFETKNVFEEDFNVLSIKNLFHNHEEVTFYLELR